MNFSNIDLNGDRLLAPLASEPVTTIGGGLTGYDGALSTDQRTSFLAFPTNSRRELNAFTRKEILRKSRALEANLPLFGRIKRKIGQHAVGKGIFVRPLTRDKEWNDLNRKRYEARAENPMVYSIDASADLYEDQRFCGESIVGDGEYFGALVKADSGANFVQRLDPFEVEQPWQLNDMAMGVRWQDGVLTNAYDRPMSYNVRELPLTDRGWFNLITDDREVSVDSMMHVFRRRRAKQTRGLPWAFSTVDNGIDALDLMALIKGKAKLHSALGVVVRKKAAEAGANGVADQVKKIIGGDGQLTRVDENFFRGAAIQYLATDEGIELINSDCPGEPLMAFIEFLHRQIAIAFDLPLEVVYNLAALGGANTRAALEDAQWLFEMVQDLIVMRHSRRHYIWDTALAVKNGVIRPCNDPEWWASAWRGPAKLTVDLGRTADAAIKLMKNASLSHVRYFEERAQDAYEEAEEEIQFLAWLKKRAEDAGVPIEWMIEPTPGAVNNISVHSSDSQAA